MGREPRNRLAALSGPADLAAVLDRLPPHDRRAYFDWLTTGKADRTQVATASDLRYYMYLALTGAFLENHCSGFGTNSTPNHLLLVGGQSPTLTNPPRRSSPVWDMPSLPGLAEDNRLSWRCYCDGGFPVRFYATQCRARRASRRPLSGCAVDLRSAPAEAVSS